MLADKGIAIAAVSYDSQLTLKDFADQHGIGYPLLSDRDSAVIKSFGLFNVNIAPGLRSYGVPHPVDYLVAPDGVVIRKYFVPNYMHRVTASAVVLREFGSAGQGAATAKLNNGPLTVEIGLSAAEAFAGQEIAFFAKFRPEPGWHVYGNPVPEAYTAASITFEEEMVARQCLVLPRAQPLEMAALGETLPVYEGSFEGTGSLLLKFPMDAGQIVLRGRLRFQACSTTVCEAPQTMPFELPLTILPFMVPPKK